MGNRSDYLKYMTERVVRYLDSPRETKLSRQEKRNRREPWLTRWFGVVPVGVRIWWGNREKTKDKAQDEAQLMNSSNYR